MVVTFDLRSRLKIVLFYLKIIGLWPTTDRYQPYTFYKFLIIFYLIVACFLFILPQVICLSLILHDLETLAASIYVVMSDLNGAIKLCLFMKNLPLVKSIMDRLDEEIYQPNNVDQKLVMMKLFKPWSIIWTTLLCFGNITVILWGFIAFINYELPFLVWLPFEQHRFFWLLFIHQVFSIYYLAMVNINIDGLFSAIMIYIASQCELLCDNLRNIHDFTRERLEKNSNNRVLDDNLVIDEYNNTLKIVVEHHRAILKLADDGNIIYTYIVAFQLCTSVLAICMTMFQLSIMEPFSDDFFNLLFYQGCMFLEILLYCWCGNEAMLSSCKIPVAAFESDWIQSTMEFKKNLLFFIGRTQKPIQLYALRFFMLSLTTFIGILRMSWSYFALLRQVNNRNK